MNPALIAPPSRTRTETRTAWPWWGSGPAGSCVPARSSPPRPPEWRDPWWASPGGGCPSAARTAARWSGPAHGRQPGRTAACRPAREPQTPGRGREVLTCWTPPPGSGRRWSSEPECILYLPACTGSSRSAWKHNGGKDYWLKSIRFSSSLFSAGFSDSRQSRRGVLSSAALRRRDEKEEREKH